jgi:hypothetical protein
MRDRNRIEQAWLSHDASFSGYLRFEPALRSPSIVSQSRITHPERSGVRSIAAPISAHPRSKPASRHSLQ